MLFGGKEAANFQDEGHCDGKITCKRVDFDLEKVLLLLCCVQLVLGQIIHVQLRREIY